ncbi:6579_t:CDS:2 [Paraglomus occultum]|uniref:6579_t:CDS:1 n=1 Tax=Paraglomus occultum TaxID=144539 RepID=A0A9N9BWG0_9GLOM|nr:6579_t:CDS:2 [Paraglomus occultum]
MRTHLEHISFEPTLKQPVDTKPLPAPLLLAAPLPPTPATLPPATLPPSTLPPSTLSPSTLPAALPPALPPALPVALSAALNPKPALLLYQEETAQFVNLRGKFTHQTGNGVSSGCFGLDETDPIQYITVGPAVTSWTLFSDYNCKGNPLAYSGASLPNNAVSARSIQLNCR